MRVPLKTVGVFVLAGLSGALLLYTSQAVQDTQRELELTQMVIEKESEEIKMLRAEWAFLSAPERLQRIAEDQLGISFEEDGIVVPNLKTLMQGRKNPQAHNASYQEGDAP